MAMKDDEEIEGIDDDTLDDDDAPPRPEPSGREREEEDGGDEGGEPPDPNDNNRVPVRLDAADRPKKRPRDERRAARFETLVETKVQEALRLAQESNERTLNTVLTHLRPPEAPPPDPIEREIDLLKREQAAVQAEINALPPAEQKAKFGEYNDKFNALTEQINDKRVELKLKQRERDAESQRQKQVEAVQNHPFMRQMRAKYADVYGDTKATAKAQEIWEKRRSKGEQPGEALFEACLVEARRSMTNGGRSVGRGDPPDDTERQRFTGTPRGSTGGGDRTRPMITKEERAMAKARYPHLTEEKAIATWYKKVKEPGERRRAEASRSKRA